RTPRRRGPDAGGRRRARRGARGDGGRGRRRRPAAVPDREHRLLPHAARQLPERDAARARRADLEQVGPLLEHLRATSALRARPARPARAPARGSAERRRPRRRGCRPDDPRARARRDRRHARGEGGVSLAHDYVVVGAGAIGGTIGARLARDGQSVLLCDADAEHVAAVNEHGLAIEGPVEQFSVRVPAVEPAGLPDELRAVLLAVKTQHTHAALEAIRPRLTEDGFVVSLQNGVNEPAIAAALGAQRTVGALVHLGADYLAPGRIFLGGRGALYVGELDGRRSERLERLLRDLPDAKETANILGFLWAKEAYGAMLFATAVSDLSIADALAEPRHRPGFLQPARAGPAPPPPPAAHFGGL